MLLAQKLFEQGDAKAAIDYVISCKSFWKSPDATKEADAWIADYKKGKTPNYGGHLAYLLERDPISQTN